VPLIEAILALTGICIFSLFIHSASFLIIIAFLGLTITAVSVNHAVDDLQYLSSVFGITPVLKKVIFYSIIGVVFGSLLGIFYRYESDSSILPAVLTKVAIISPLIGIAEELVFRGFIQGRIHPFGKIISVIFAAAGHSIYKYLVFISLPFSIGIDFPLLITLTFFVGIIFGSFREASNNVIPPSIAHAGFDIVVYGGYMTSPVWVWT